MKHHNLSPVSWLIFGAWLWVGCGLARAADSSAAILFTADTQGHIHACQSCPGHSGIGGLDRRATLIKSLRAEHPGSVLIDGGGALFGEESAESGGAVIASAYSAMGYDLVNLGAQDFRQGKAHTLELLQKSKLKALSANLLDDATGQPLAEPMVVFSVGDRKIAFIGLAQAPPGLALLPKLQKQLAGIRFQPEAEALAVWLPKARAAADAVVIVYSGSPLGLNAIQKSAGDGVLAILAAGDEGSSTTAKPVIATAQSHGRSIGVVTLVGADVKADQAIVLPTIAPDVAMTTLVDSFATSPPMVLPMIAANQPGPASTTAPSLVETTPATLPAVARSDELMPRPNVGPPAIEPANPTTLPKPPEPAHSPAVAPSATRVAAHQPLEPKGLAGVNLTEDQVNAAIDRGRDFLWAHLLELQKKHNSPTIVDTGEDLLAVLALVHAGAPEKIPAFNAELRKYLDGSDPRRKPRPVYETGIYCMLIEAFGDPTYLPKLRDAARYLVEIQGPGGAWNYGWSLADDNVYGPPPGAGQQSLTVLGGTPLDGGKPVIETLARITPFKKDTDGDNSTSQFALLGIRSAARWNLVAAPDVWAKNLAILRVRQCADSGWDYKQDGAIGYGSMTCAGICALAIDRYQLGEKDPAGDEQIERGLSWLDQRFSVTSNPARGAAYLYYYLYSLERVGRILDTEFIGSHEWYPLGARFLVDAQKPSGKWVESLDEEDPRLATSFALLFLTRATAALNNELARNGSGELRTALTTAPPSRLYLILDASGSMLDEMDGRLKFDIARDAASAMLGMLPGNGQAALRVYGHRLRSLEKGSDEDTELKIPMGPYDSEKFATVLKALRSKGKTPLALSLTLAMQDLGPSPEPTTLVLLTDGGEDTMPRRDPVKIAAGLARIPNLTFHIIGFDINQQDWSEQLHAMAQASGGKYWPAPKSADLNRVLRAVLLGDPDYFRIIDSTGKEVFRGKFGQSTRLLEGKYDMITPFAGREFHQTFWINTKGMTVVTFDAAAVGRDKTVSDVAPKTPPPTPTSPAKATPHFCTNCGKPLPPGAKFCPSCGKKVSMDLR